MAADKKRPRGLKGSAANKAVKKVKTDDESQIPENAQTVLLDKVVEEGDEVGEVAALLESAIEKLDDNPSEALALLRGTVHEADRILRNWQSETPLPPKFYLSYGSALYELGRLMENEELELYLEAAEERLQDGLRHYEELSEKEAHENDAHTIRLTMGKVWLTKHDSEPKNRTEVPALAKSALDLMTAALKHITLPTNVSVELAVMVRNYGDQFTDFDARNTFHVWSTQLLERVLEGEPENPRALTEFGQNFVSLSDYWLDQGDEEEGEEEKQKEERSLEEQKAYDAITMGRQYLKKAYDVLTKTATLTPKACADLAEVYLDEANLTLEEEEQEKLYLLVKQYGEEAQHVSETLELEYSLPEGLQSFLDSEDGN